MTYKIIDIQGVGPVYAEKLIAAGVETVDQLLAKGKTPKGRKELEDATGFRRFCTASKMKKRQQKQRSPDARYSAFAAVWLSRKKTGCASVGSVCTLTPTRISYCGICASAVT